MRSGGESRFSLCHPLYVATLSSVLFEGDQDQVSWNTLLSAFHRPPRRDMHCGIVIFQPNHVLALIHFFDSSRFLGMESIGRVGSDGDSHGECGLRFAGMGIAESWLPR